MQSRAPPHYPCGPSQVNETEQLVPHFFWANQIPDASTSVDLVVDGAPVSFKNGTRYHDKNWGDAEFSKVVKTWHWGHAYLTPYSIVWFDAVDSTGTEHFSGYVHKDGEEGFTAACGDNAVVVRPWSESSRYPPTVLTGAMQGLEVTFALGIKQSFYANVTTGEVSFSWENYIRNRGIVVGGVIRAKGTVEGFVLFEEFKYST